MDPLWKDILKGVVWYRKSFKIMQKLSSFLDMMMKYSRCDITKNWHRHSVIQTLFKSVQKFYLNWFCKKYKFDRLVLYSLFQILDLICEGLPNAVYTPKEYSDRLLWPSSVEPDQIDHGQHWLLSSIPVFYTPFLDCLVGMNKFRMGCHTLHKKDS